ncbi:MAG: SIMPL domain-containing protein [Oscillospiraceae bacterium]|jgi:hypothetical protein|nr:SIMPL domain-containing protein [Oscillospiraceae bacterium]
MKEKFSAKHGVLGVCVVIAILIFSVAMLLSVKTAVGGLVEYKSNAAGGITATGSASVDFKSDRAMWSGSFSGEARTTQEAYEIIEHGAEVIRDYLIESGVQESAISFGPVSIYEQSRSLYSDSGNYIGDEFEGYNLSQRVFIGSDDVDLVEEISNDITSLIMSGVNIVPGAPEYYYTRLDEMKLDLIEQATQNARARVELVAENAGAKIGKLQNAQLGVFQITATNSASDEFSSYGTLNTWSKQKTASITVKLYYSVD